MPKRNNTNPLSELNGPTKKVKAQEWQCPLCLKKLSVLNKNRHLRAHNKNFDVDCPICTITLTRTDALKRHLIKIHPEPANWRCRLCDAEMIERGLKLSDQTLFPDIATLISHMKSHDGDKENKTADTEDNIPNNDIATSNEEDVAGPSTSREHLTIPSPSPLVPTATIETDPLPVSVQPTDDYYEFHNEPADHMPLDVFVSIQNALPVGAHNIILQNWQTIRSYVTESDPIDRRYNYRLIGGNDHQVAAAYFRWMARRVREETGRAFTVKAAPHVLLENKTNEYRYFYGSHNNVIPFPRTGGNGYFPINTQTDVVTFADILHPDNIMKTASQFKQGSSDWRVVAILGVHFYMLLHPERIIGTAVDFPPHLIRRDKWLHKYQIDYNQNPISDNLCVFRLIADEFGARDGKPSRDDVHRHFREYSQHYGLTGMIETFPGVDMSDLHLVEDFFKVQLQVYLSSEEEESRKIRVSVCRLAPDMTENGINRPLLYVHMHKTQQQKLHFCRISNINRFASVFFCVRCNAELSTQYNLDRHMKSNTACFRGATHFNFPGGMYEGPKSIFEMLSTVGIKFDEPVEQQFYPYRVTFDYESLLATLQLGVQRQVADTEREIQIQATLNALQMEVTAQEGKKRDLQYLNKHVPITFCIDSNIPGYDQESFIVTDKNPDTLIDVFLRHLEELSDTARQLMRAKYATQINALDALVTEAKRRVDAEDMEWAQNHDYSQHGTHAKGYYGNLTKLKCNFNTWLNQLIVIGFNSGRYDLNLIRKYLYPKLVKQSQIRDQQLARTVSLPDYDVVAMKRYGVPTRNVGEVENARPFDIRDFLDDEAAVDRDEPEDETGLPLEERSVPRESKELDISDLPTIIKGSTGIMALMTKSLKFLDMSRFLAAGYSLDKFLKSWIKQDEFRAQKNLPECEFGLITQSKIPFPYSFLDDVSKLEYIGVPPREAFNNSLRRVQITDVEYQQVVDLYENEGFVNFQDYLHFYVQADTRPFLQAVNKSFMQWWDISGIDIFKQCLSLPGITLNYLEQMTPGGFNFTLFGPNDAELHKSLRKSICGGLSVVNNRYALVGETEIRGNPEFKVQSIMGLDFNALYLAALANYMPTGFHVHWKWFEGRKCLSRDKHKSTNKPIAQEWLEYVAASRNIDIVHAQRNGYEKRVGPKQYPVDGMDESNKTVYEFLGCYWHTHCPTLCSLMTQDFNGKTKKSVIDCQDELEYRISYMEREGYKVEYIYECQWLAMKQRAEVQQVLQKLPRRKLFAGKNYLSVKALTKAVLDETVFGFIEVDLHTPEHLKDFMSDFPPVIKHAQVSIDDVGELMADWCRKNGQLKKPVDCLIGSFHGKKVWLLTSVLKYLMDKGLVLDRIHQFLHYDKEIKFDWFSKVVSEKRAEADKSKELAMIGESFKLLGNTGYGKCCTNLENHLNVSLVGIDQMRICINSPYLKHVEAMGDGIYEISMRPRRKQMNLPLQIGLAVYQWAKYYMLRFAYDLLGKYADPRMYDWMESDTDSIYLMIAAKNFDDIIRPELRAEYETIKKDYFVIDEETQLRTPGLLKLEYSNGYEMVCLNPKTYAIRGWDQDKVSTKGLMKRSNETTVDIMRAVLENQSTGSGVNSGMRMYGSDMVGYVQVKVGLSFQYIKRIVLANGRSTKPLDI